MAGDINDDLLVAVAEVARAAAHRPGPDDEPWVELGSTIPSTSSRGHPIDDPGPGRYKGERHGKKRATYVEFPPELLAALDGYVKDERKRTGKSVSRSEIVTDAVLAYLNPEPWVDYVPSWVDHDIAEAGRTREE